jgi:hypothetical protein
MAVNCCDISFPKKAVSSIPFTEICPTIPYLNKKGYNVNFFEQSFIQTIGRHGR